MLQSHKACATEAPAQKGRAWGTYASAERQHCGVPRRALDRPGQSGYCKPPGATWGAAQGQEEVVVRGGDQPGAGETNTAQWITRWMLEQSDIHPEGGELWHVYPSSHAIRSR